MMMLMITPKPRALREKKRGEKERGEKERGDNLHQRMRIISYSIHHYSKLVMDILVN